MILLVCCVLFLPGAVKSVLRADRQPGSSTVPEATISSRLTHLPIVDAYDIRFARVYTVEGPSKSNAGPFTQDDQGFIWFGTPNGLNRFDGFTFKVLTHDPKNPRSIGGSFIHSLFKDRNGTLWAGSNQCLNRFDSRTETFSRYPVPYVTHISQDDSGTLWLSTPTGLYALDPSTGQIRHFPHDPGDSASLESNDIKSTGEDRKGTFWVATSEGMDSFDRRAGKVLSHIPIHESSGPFSFYEDRYGVFWIYHVSGNPLAVFDRKTNTLTQFSFREEHSEGNALTGVTGMLEDQAKTLWLSTNGGGLLKFDRQHQRFVRYRNSLNDPDSLAQNSVSTIFQDREGLIWASLGGFGVTRFTPKPLPFKRYRHDFGDPADRDEPFVGAIYEDNRGILWVGTHSGLHRIDRKIQGEETFYLTGSGEGTDAITIKEDRIGFLWVGTYGHGLFRFDPRTRSFARFQHDPANPYSLSNDIVPRVFVDHSGTLWAATHDGLDRFNPTTNSFTTYKVESPAVRPYYLEVAEDRAGILWLGTESSGLLRFDPTSGTFKRYQHDENRSGTLSDNRVNSIHFDRSGTMWVGTQEGLNQFDPVTGRFATYSSKEGLPGNVIGCILEDERGSLWMSTDNGIAKIDSKTKEVKSYSTADGLPGPDLTGWGACFHSRTGEMFFGGFSGATAFFPEDVSDSTFVPPVALTEFRLFGTEVLPGAGSPLSRPINYTDAVTLLHKQNRFSIGFSALSYLNPATNRYRYMLENLDRQWNAVGSDQRFASYTTLPAGKYIFRVEGATSRGAWNEPGTSLRIEILPAWWDSWWFRVAYIAALLLILITIYIRHKQRQKREAEHAETLRRARTDLARINRVSTMEELTASLAHEIKQPIGAAVTNAEACLRLLERNEPDIAEAREAALEMARDARCAADIIDRVRSFYQKGSSQPEMVNVNDIIREMVIMLRNEANQHSVAVRTDLDEALPKVMADRVQLLQVLMNLMINGIEAMRDEPGELSIRSAWAEDGQLLISVADTGTGLPSKNLDQIFNAFFTTKPQGTGLGLAITRSIVESHGGRIWAAANSGRGTTFHFTLPIGTTVSV